MDRSHLDALYAGVGSAAFDPVLLLKMVLYQYCMGVLSPAKWFHEASLNDAMKWLGRGYVPSRRTWYTFRDRVGQVVERIHAEMVQSAIDQKLIDPSIGVQDGTAVAACASRHRMLNMERLVRRIELLTAVQKGEHSRTERVPGWVPPTEAGRVSLLRKMQVAEKVLSERIRENAKKESGKRKDPGKILVSITDPMAPMGRDKMKVFRPLYTIQLMVEPESRLILSYQCEPSVSDCGTLLPMLIRTQKTVRGSLKKILADATYCTILNLRGCLKENIELIGPVQANSFTEQKKKAKEQVQIPREDFTYDRERDVYICPVGQELRYEGRERKKRGGDQTLWQSRYRCTPDICGACTKRFECLRSGSSCRTIKCLEGQELLDAQKAKSETPEFKKLYALRCQTVELGFADARRHRGVSSFHGRGPERAAAETGLFVIAQCIIRLEALYKKSGTPSKTTT